HDGRARTRKRLYSMGPANGQQLGVIWLPATTAVRLTTVPGVENVAQAVPQQADAQHRHEDRQPGIQRQPPNRLHVASSDPQRGAPGGCRWLHPEAEERKRRLGEDGRGYGYRSLYQ